jgi:hypothetical protein
MSAHKPTWYPTRFCFLIVLVLPLLVARNGQGQSVSPCTRNANQAARYCGTICRIAKSFDLGACVPRDMACMASCKTVLSGCRSPAGIEDDTLECIETFEAARVACVAQFPDASSAAFLACIEAAREAAVTCRAGFLRSVLREDPFCRRQFESCRNDCPRTASANVQQCRVQATDVYTSCLTRCADDRRAALALCGGLAPDCVSTCDAGLPSCTGAATRDEKGILACKAAYLIAVQACQALGSPPSCIAAAKEALEGCAGPIYDSAAAAFVGCDLAFDGCVSTCPPS